MRAQIKSISSTTKTIEKIDFSETKVCDWQKKTVQKKLIFYSKINSDPGVRIDATKPQCTTN